MSTAGPNQAGTAADGGAYGSTAWTNPSKATVDNNDFATAVTPGSDNTHYLDLTNFGTFTGVGSSDVVDTIQIEVKIKSSVAGCQWANFDLIYAGTPAGFEVSGGASSPAISTSAAYISLTFDPVNDYGFPSVTGAVVNNAGFGVRLVFYDNDSAMTISVDAVRITLTGTFTGGGGGGGNRRRRSIILRAG